jgi:hypothetical protein
VRVWAKPEVDRPPFAAVSARHLPGTDAVLRVVLPNGTRLEVPERDPAVLRLIVQTVLRQAATSILKRKRYRLRDPQRRDRKLESEERKAQADAPDGTNSKPARGARRDRRCLNQPRPIHHELFHNNPLVGFGAPLSGRF